MASHRDLVETQLLLLQYRQGKRGSLERLVSLWERPLYYYVRRLLNTSEEARDVTQDIWVKVVQKLRTVRDPAAFPAWLFKTARNQAASHFRSTKLLDPLPEEGSGEAIRDPGSDFSLNMDAEELHWGLNQLGPIHSECLILHFLEGFSIQEVADITGVAPGTVKSRLHYAKNALRGVLKKEVNDEHQRSER